MPPKRVGEGVILERIGNLEKTMSTRFDGIDERLDEANGNVAALNVFRGGVTRRHERADDRAEDATERTKSTKSTIRFWALIITVIVGAATQIDRIVEVLK